MKIYQEFLTTVKRFPQYKAISDESESLSYLELAKRVYNYIEFLPTIPQSCGVIYLPKSIDVIAFQLALNAKNIAFLTLEWGQDGRKEECITQVKPSLIITLIKNKVEIIKFDKFKSYPLDVGYIVFSSGSTGIPKQIWMKDYPVVNVTKQQAKITSFKESSVFLWLLNSAFDASISDIYVTLFSGGHLVVTQCNPLNTKEVFKLIKLHNVTHTDIPPVVFSLWLKKFKQGKIHSSLKNIVFGGELANESITKELLEFTNLYNAYGPTEITICSSMCQVDKNWSYNNVGRPLEGVFYKIVDDELHIGGEHCSIGYDNEILNQKFYTENNIKWFRTGDVFKENNGNYFYGGRKDRQFKHNGQLVCPEEIENKAKNSGAENSQVTYIKNKITLYYSGLFRKEEFEKNIVSWMKPHLYREIATLEGNINQNWKLKVND